MYNIVCNIREMGRVGACVPAPMRVVRGGWPTADGREGRGPATPVAYAQRRHLGAIVSDLAQSPHGPLSTGRSSCRLIECNRGMARGCNSHGRTARGDTCQAATLAPRDIPMLGERCEHDAKFTSSEVMLLGARREVVLSTAAFVPAPNWVSRRASRTQPTGGRLCK